MSASDVTLGLPVRDASDIDRKLQVKIVDYTDVSKGVTVDSDSNAHVEIHGNGPTGTDHPVRTSELGHIAIDGIWHTTDNTDPSNFGIIGHTRAATPTDVQQIIRITAGPAADGVVNANIHALDVNAFQYGFNATTGNWDRVHVVGGAMDVNADMDGVYDVGTNPLPDSVGVIFNARNAAPDVTTQTFRSTGINATDDNTVWAIDMALHDQSGNAYTRSNPLPVYLTDESGGIDFHDYFDNTDTATAASATDNHDYIVAAGKTLILKQVSGSCAGRAKFVLQIETAVASGTFTNKGAWFTTESDSDFDCKFAEPIEVITGITVRVARTNRDTGDATSIYDFINGELV